jgi:hypothetical protein
MKHIRLIIAPTMAFVLVFSFPSVLTAGPQYSESDYYFYEPGPVRQSRLYIDGSVIELETGSLTCPVVGSDLSNITPAQFLAMAKQAQKDLENAPNKLVVSPGRSRQGGVNIVYNCVNVPAEALPALESVAVYIEHLFTDTATITINMSFASLGPGILGMAQRFYAGNPSYTITRSSLVADMDGDDSIQTWLPTGSTFPVRYTYASPTVTNEDRVYFVVAPYNAVIGYYSGVASNITYSTNITWDYDPRDGVTGYCFQSVVAHEIGHVLGFTSKASEYGDCDVLDLYRFQRSDSAGNYNPDTWYDFQNTARMVDDSPGNDDVNSDMIEVEYRMSDGSPYQTSHFSQGFVQAIMQPAMSSNQTYYPNFYRVPDRNMFDAIGWDYILNYYLTINIVGEGSVSRNPDTTWFTPGASVQITAYPDSGWMFSNWVGGVSGTNNPETVIMNGDVIVTALFETQYVTLTVNIIGNGTVNVTPNLPEYPRDTLVELFAVPDPGWSFSHWGGALYGSQNPDTLLLDDNKTVYATFIETGVEEGKSGIMASNYLNISPNPTTGQTDIRYMLHDTGYMINDITLQIYDIYGRLVRSFYPEAGILDRESTISWDGTDQTNRQVGSGVYFVKFRAGDYQATNKILLVK